MAIDRLSDVSGRYDVLFVDIWGVLHDGHSAYQGAAQALAATRRGGSWVVLITNSSSSVGVIADNLDRLGIPRDAWDGIMSSGELSFRHLTATTPPPPIYVIREGQGPRWLGGLSNPVVATVKEAAALLVTGMPYHTEAEARASDVADILCAARDLDLDLICTDPDETYPENGSIRLGPGWVSRQYRQIGGSVLEFGKPNPDIYAAARELVGHPPTDRVLAIGDNLLTDIAGANREGYDSLLVLEGGVHGSGGLVFTGKDEGGPLPTYVAPRLA